MKSKTVLSEKSLEIFTDFSKTLEKQKSRDDYYYIINSFCRDVGKDYLDADYEDFRQYFEMLEEKAASGHISYKTISAKYTVLISFSSYIVSHAAKYGVRYKNHLVRIPKPAISVNIKPQSMPTLEQLDKIYTVASEDPMMYCIISLVNKCGLTVEQICSLKLANFLIDAENRCGMLFAFRSSADKYIKIPEDVCMILDDYVNHIRKSKSEFLFCNRRNDPLTKRVLQIRMQRIVTEASEGENWKFTLQDIRNLAVVMMLRGGAEKEEVADYIGVESRWMQRYESAVAAFDLAPCDYINIKIAR